MVSCKNLDPWVQNGWTASQEMSSGSEWLRVVLHHALKGLPSVGTHRQQLAAASWELTKASYRVCSPEVGQTWVFRRWSSLSS